MPRGREGAVEPMCCGSKLFAYPRCGAARCPDAVTARCCSLQGHSQECDCNYKYKFPSGGCKISITPPSYTTCKCNYKGAWTCGGELTSCPSYNALCATPDSSINTCRLGGGDCGGY
jgi:hypothetical protein